MHSTSKPTRRPAPVNGAGFGGEKTFLFMNYAEITATAQEIPAMIKHIRKHWIVIRDTNNCGLITGRAFIKILGPHRPGHVSNLTMGDYRNYSHTEISVSIFDDGHIRLHQWTVNNNHVSTGGCSYPYTNHVLHVKKEEQDIALFLIDSVIHHTTAGTIDNILFSKKDYPQF